MKLDAKQKNWISQLVFSNVKYNETYLEVMDHVISSIEAEQDKNITFHQKLNQIWKEDFGGYENLPYLEIERRKVLSKQISKRYWSIFKSYFKLPLAISTVLFSLGFYVVSFYFLSNDWLFLILISCMFTPFLVHTVMYWKLKKYDLYKVSIKDKKLDSIKFSFYRVFLLSIMFPIIFSHTFYDFKIEPNTVYSPIYIFLIVIFCVHTLSYFKIYKETFKMELAK